MGPKRRCYRCGRRVLTAHELCESCGAPLLALCECGETLSAFDDSCSVCGLSRAPSVYSPSRPWLLPALLFLLLVGIAIPAVSQFPTDPERQRREDLFAATAAHRQGQFDEARLRFADYIETWGEDARSRYMLALAHYELGAERQAVDQAGRAVALQPDYDLALVFLSSLAFRRGHHALALRHAEQALSTGSRPAAAHLIAGKVLAQSDRPNIARALWHLEKSMEAGHTDPEGAFLYAELVLVMNRAEPAAVRRETSRVFLSRAKVLLREKLAEAPGDAGLHLFLARLEHATGDASAARIHLDRSIALAKWLPGQRVLKARLEWENGNEAESRRVLDEVLAGTPGVGILTEIIEFLRSTGQAEAASRALAAARRLRPEDPDIQSFVALDLLVRRDVPAAIEILRPLRRDHPTKPRILVMLARSLRMIGRDEEAEQALRAELAHALPDPLVMLALADLLLDTPAEQRNSAVRCIEGRALIDAVMEREELREPLGHQLALLSGKSELRRRRFAAARRLLTKAISLNSSNAEAHLLLAGAEEALGEYYDAAESLWTAMRLSSEAPALLARRVELLLRLGPRHLDRARTCAEAAHAAHPEHEAVVMALARVRERSGRSGLAKARVLLEAAQARPGATAMPVLTLAELEAERGHHGLAESILAETIGRTGTPEERILATGVLGRILGRRGVIGIAEAAFQEFFRTHPEDIATELRYASLLLQSGDMEAAGSRAGMILARAPDDPTARLILFEVSLQGGVDAARAHLDSVRVGDPENPAIDYMEGRLALLDGKPELAAEHFERAAEATPLDARNAFHLALARYELGDIEGARAAVEHALRLRPRLEQARLLLAEIAFCEARSALLEGADPEAVSDLRLSLEGNPERTSARALLAATQFRLGHSGMPGNLEEAEHQCLAVIEDLHQNRVSGDALGRAWLLLAGIRLAANDREGLLVACDRYLELYPGDIPAILRKASALMADHQSEAAAKLLMKAREAAPAEWPLADALVDIQLRSGNPRGAEAVLREWVSGHPEDSRVRYRLGTVLARTTGAAAAEREYRAALAIDPGFQDAASALADLLLSSDRAEAALGLARDLHRRSSGDAESGFLLAQVLLGIDPADAEGVALLESTLRSGQLPAESRAHGFVVLLRTHFSNGRFGAAERAAESFHDWARNQAGVGEDTELAALLAEGYCVSGAIHHHAGDLQLARNRYLRAVEHRRDHALALNNLAVLTLSEPVSRSAPGVREALLLAERAVEIMPGAADFRDTLGSALAAAGRHLEATRAYSEAVRLFSRRTEGPDTPNRLALRQSLARTLIRLSISQKVMGNADAAAAALREATVADPAVVGEALYLEALYLQAAENGR